MKVTYIDPTTGGYNVVNNELITANATINKVNRLLAQRIGGDMYNPTLGNPLIGMQNITPSDIINAIPVCLSPLIATMEITSFTILTITKTFLGRWKVEIEIFLPFSNSEVLTWTDK